jgi:hypothetical protein
MREGNTIFRDRHLLIDIERTTSKSANWILRLWEISWWRKKQILSHSYNDRRQALEGAELLKSQYQQQKD